MKTLLALALTVLLQEKGDDFQKRVRVDGARVLIDDTVLFEGPWQKTDVAVREFKPFKEGPEAAAYKPWRHVILSIDGEERLRLPVPSLARPVAWPPFRHDELKPSLKKQTDTVDGKKTLLVFVSTEKGDHEIYRGPVAETKLERKIDSFTVWLNGEVLFRVARSSRPASKPDDLLEAVNVYRVQAGVAKVKLSASLSRGCDLHALYLVKNEPRGLSSHDEDPKGIGYSDEGARAGRRSVISAFGPAETPREGLDSLVATLYHRVAVLHPALTEIGVGWAWRRDGNGHLVIDVGSCEGKVEAKAWPVCYPAAGQKGVPLVFALGSRETPNPLPDDAGTAGYPVTIQYPETSRAKGDPKPRLLLGNDEVPCYLSTPEKPARSDWPQAGVIALIPKEKLKPETTYIVKLLDRLTGEERTWFFNTGK